jgi:hypothetical protein
MLIVANFCLCAGIVVQYFAHSLHARHSGWIDFAQGFLYGMAIVFFYWVARQNRRRCANSGRES